MKQYIVEYYAGNVASGKKKPEDAAESKADELDFKEEFGGEWKNVVVERAGRGPVHICRLPAPVTASLFRISGICNQGLPRQHWDTHISEVELYESRWPTAGGSSLRSYHAGSGGPDEKLTVGKPILGGGRFAQTTPAFANGTLYLAKGDAMHAVRLEDLGENWAFKIKDYKAIQSSPTIAGNLVLFGGDDYELRAVDCDTGDLAWSFATEFKITGSPCVVGNKAIAGSADGFVYAVDLKTGAPLWKYEAGQPISASVAADSDTVYFGSFNRQVQALDANSGTNRWIFKTGGAIRSGVAVAEDAVYVGSDDGQVYAVDKVSGTQLWTQKTGGYIEAVPAVDDRAVYIGSVDGIFRALDRKTGAALWTMDVKSPIRHAALVLGEQIFFYADDSILRQVNRRTGNQHAQVNLPYPGLTDITPVGASLFLGMRYGYCAITQENEKK